MDPSPVNRKILRRMDYLSDQKGILNRYLAEGDNWEPHLKHTRDFIVQCLGEKHYGTMVVLGSGWLLDLPLDIIASRTREVYLLDIVHPPQILKRIDKYKNVKAINTDITGGGINGTFRFASTHRKPGKESILEIAFRASLNAFRPDYVISLNILNQLDILLIDYLKKNIEIPPQEELEFRKRIQSQHLSLLKPGKSCLITDSLERVINKKGRQVSEKNLIHCELPDGQRKEEWIWNFDSRGEYIPRHLTEMYVSAIQL
jgi:hypothetical protein